MRFLIIVFFSLIISCNKEQQSVPVAEFTYSYLNQCEIPSQISFENLSLHGEIYCWDFGDNTQPKYGKNAVHIFNNEGIYKVTLTVYGNGGMNSEQKLIYVVKKPQISFQVSDTIANVNDTIFLHAHIISGILPSSWFWTFGDGYTSTLQNPFHIYTSPGIYDVSLTAVNACGSSYLEQKKIIKIINPGTAPIANFTSNTITITANQSVNFTDLSLNSPTSWQWTFHGAIPSTSNQQHPTNILYPVPGIYDVSLTVSNQHGTNTITKQGYISVLPSSPTQCLLNKITVKQLPFPPYPPFVNLFYKVTDYFGNLYLNGVSQIIHNLYQNNLPVSFIINPHFTFPNLNRIYRIELYDKKQQYDNFISFVNFNPANYNNYPTNVELIQNGLVIELELIWQ